jgi:hypothetical protein
MEISFDDIRQLRKEAWEHSDYAMVEICDIAIMSDSFYTPAFKECARVIREAKDNSNDL